MAKRILCFALGGHIANQNASFRRLTELLEPRGYKVYGAEDGFRAFETGKYHLLELAKLHKNFAGFYTGAGRDSLVEKKEDESDKRIEISKAVDFIRREHFDVIVGSGGDDHSYQMDILRKSLEGKARVFAFNKTMDNDLGGPDGIDGPYTEFTNGFHSAITNARREIGYHLSGGAWTNNVPYLVGLFGRESNWVSAVLGRYSFADRVIYGELAKEHPGHSIKKIYELIKESQSKRKAIHGRKISLILLAEGTKVSGVEHAKDLLDIHGHKKLEPAVLAANLKEELEKQFGMKTHSIGITYEMRNYPPSPRDIRFGEMSAEVIADSILADKNGLESVFNFNDGKVLASVAPIDKVARKRLCSDYERAKGKQLINRETFEPTEEIEYYYLPLFGKRRKFNMPDALV